MEYTWRNASPMHPLCSRYLHFLICTPLCHFCFSPLNSISTSLVSKGPTSHLKPSTVIMAFISADHCRCHNTRCTQTPTPPEPSVLCGVNKKMDLTQTLTPKEGTLLTGNHLLKRSAACGGIREPSTPDTACCCCFELRPFIISLDSSTNPSYPGEYSLPEQNQRRSNWLASAAHIQ